MRKIKSFCGHAILKLTSLIPARSAVAVFLIGVASLLTAATSCRPHVRCYEPAFVPKDSVSRNSTDTPNSPVQDSVIENNEKN